MLPTFSRGSQVICQRSFHLKSPRRVQSLLRGLPRLGIAGGHEDVAQVICELAVASPHLICGVRCSPIPCRGIAFLAWGFTLQGVLLFPVHVGCQWQNPARCWIANPAFKVASPSACRGIWGGGWRMMILFVCLGFLLVLCFVLFFFKSIMQQLC